MIGIGIGLMRKGGGGDPTGPILNTAPALDMGYARNGETITRTQGSYSARGGGVVTITVSEFRVDDVQVATVASYTPDGADEGLVLTYVETATEAGGTADGSRTTTISLGAVLAPVAAPVASNLTATVIDETSASLTVDTNKGDGDVFAVAINTGTGTYPPTAAQVIAGTDGADAAAAWDHNQGISASGTQTFAGGMTGLTEGATYRAYAVYRDGDLTVSAVVATGDFVPADVTPPNPSYLVLAKDGSNNWTGTVNTDVGEGVLDVVITTSATPPTAGQIMAGQDHTGAAAADAIADQAVVAAGVQNLTGNSALSGATEYWGHGVHTDAAGNTSVVLTTPTSFTTDAATVPAAFVDANWSVATGTGNATLDVTIASLPDNGGSAITDVEYDVDGGGTWTSLPAYAGTGSYAISMAAGDTSYGIRLRAVNAVGNAPAGNTESATSSAASAGPALSDYSAANPMVIAHRGGMYIAPEHSLIAYTDHVAKYDWEVFEPDIIKTSDGEFALSHDDDASILTNGTGTVSGMTAATWKSFTIDKQDDPPGYSPQSAAVLSDLVAAIPDKIIVPELKRSDQVAFKTYLDGLPADKTQWLIQAFDGGRLTALNADGYETMLMFGNPSSAEIDSTAAAGHQWIGMDGASVTTAKVAEAVADGLKPAIWTCDRREGWQAFNDAGAVAAFSNDPTYLRGEWSAAADTWSTGFLMPGMIHHSVPEFSSSSLGDLSLAARGDVYSGGYWGWAAATATSSKDFVLQGWATLPARKASDEYSVDFTLKPTDQGGGTTAEWAAIAMHDDSLGDNAFTDAGGAGQNGYNCLMRLSGDMALYRITSGSATLLDDDTSGSALSIGTDYHFRLEVTPSAISLHRLDVSGGTPIQTVTSTDTTHRGGYFSFGRRTIGAQFKDVSITLPVPAAPTATGAPSTSGTPQVGRVITGIDGTYDGYPAPTVGSYQWQISNDGSTGWADISGATSANYTPIAADENKYVRRKETATNSEGSLDAYTPATAQITVPPVFNDPSDLASTVDWWVTDQGCTVSTWTSQAGSATTFTQGTTAAQPSLANSKNSINVLTFDGTDDVMMTNEGTPSIYAPLPAFRIRANNGSAFYGALNSTDGEFSAVNASSTNRSGWGVWEAVFDATANTATLIKDGVQLGQATDYTGSKSGHIFIVAGDLVVNDAYDLIVSSRSNYDEGLMLAQSIGVGPYMGMKVAEISVHNQPVIGTDLTDMRSYFATKWAL